MNKLNKISYAIILLIGGTLAGVLIAEIIVATLFPQKIGRINIADPFFGRYDPDIGWVNKENAKGIHRPNPNEPGGQVTINSKGLRGREFPFSKTQGKTRILVLGDSIAFGYGIDEMETFPYMLQGFLGSDYEVINAATIGYGTDQEYLFLKREGLKYKPDVVLVEFSAGDIYDVSCSMRYGAFKPYFRLVNGKLELKNVPVPKTSSIRDLYGENPIRDFMLQASHLYRLIYHRLTDPSMILQKSKEEMNRMEGLRVTTEIIRRMKKDCSDNECKLRFVVIPQNNWIEAVKAGSKEGDIFKVVHQASLDVLEEAGVQYIDLWEPFTRIYSNSLFLSGDYVHTNAKGNELIAREILRSGLL